MKYDDIKSGGFIECPVCGHRVGYKYPISPNEKVYAKPRVSDLARHMIMKDDELHRKWIKERLGELPSNLRPLTDYLKKTNYVKKGEFMGLEIFLPL